MRGVGLSGKLLERCVFIFGFNLMLRFASPSKSRWDSIRAPWRKPDKPEGIRCGTSKDLTFANVGGERTAEGCPIGRVGLFSYCGQDVQQVHRPPAMRKDIARHGHCAARAKHIIITFCSGVSGLPGKELHRLLKRLDVGSPLTRLHLKLLNFSLFLSDPLFELTACRHGGPRVVNRVVWCVMCVMISHLSSPRHRIHYR